MGGRWDSNPRPQGPQPCALTWLSYAHHNDLTVPGPRSEHSITKRSLAANSKPDRPPSTPPRFRPTPSRLVTPWKKSGSHFVLNDPAPGKAPAL